MEKTREIGCPAIEAAFPPTTTCLSFLATNLTDVDIEALCMRLDTNPIGLQKIDLGGNDAISNIGAKAISKILKKLPELYFLDLSECSIGDEGGEVLVHALRENEQNIVHLDLHGNYLKEHMLRELGLLVCESKTLHYLAVHDNRGENHLLSDLFETLESSKSLITLRIDAFPICDTYDYDKGEEKSENSTSSIDDAIWSWSRGSSLRLCTLILHNEVVVDELYGVQYWYGQFKKLQACWKVAAMIRLLLLPALGSVICEDIIVLILHWVGGKDGLGWKKLQKVGKWVVLAKKPTLRKLGEDLWHFGWWEYVYLPYLSKWRNIFRYEQISLEEKEK